MKRLEVWRARSRPDLFLIVQSDRFAHLRTRLVVPPTPDPDQTIDAVLNPPIALSGVVYHALTHLAFVTDRSALGSCVDFADEAHDAVRDAIDLLTLGF